MSGKCRPCLRIKTLVNLDRASRAGYISMTDYNCVKSVFEKLEEYERRYEKLSGETMNCASNRDITRINVQFGFALTEEQSEKIYNFIDENISEDWTGFQQDITEG